MWAGAGTAGGGGGGGGGTGVTPTPTPGRAAKAAATMEDGTRTLNWTGHLPKVTISPASILVGLWAGMRTLFTKVPPAVLRSMT